MSSPVDRGREQFGARLRVLREDAGLTGRELAARLDWVGSKVSRLEHGRRAATTGDVQAWADAVDASGDVLEDLLADLRQIRLEHRRWTRQLRRGIAARQRVAIRHDATVTAIDVYEPTVIPGLLQTAAYARHVIAAVATIWGTRDTEEAVRVRLVRQDVLHDPDKRLRFLVTEAALRSLVCPPHILGAQLDRLLVDATLAGVEIAVIPFTSQLPRGLPHGFWLYDDRLALAETLTAELVVRDADDLAVYRRVYDDLWAAAISGADADAFIATVASSLPSR